MKQNKRLHKRLLVARKQPTCKPYTSTAMPPCLYMASGFVPISRFASTGCLRRLLRDRRWWNAAGTACNIFLSSCNAPCLVALRKRLWHPEGTTIDIRQYQQGPPLEPSKSQGQQRDHMVYCRGTCMKKFRVLQIHVKRGSSC
jgi:hypothetical protein